jgi:hypothetical protein
LALKFPELAKEWHPTKNGELTPFDINYGSHRKVWWLCKKCGLAYLSTISHRKHGHGCPYCAGQKVCKNNCLATIKPELSKEWHPTKNGKLTPYDVTVWCSKKACWKCPKCGREYWAEISNRSGGTSCPACHKIKLKNGVFCDSKPEAYYWLILDGKGIKFEHHVKIGLGVCFCDFYIPSTNTYIETTSYTKKWKHWKTYKKSILRKKRYITKTLKANFLFIQLKLTPKQIQYVRENMA